jgi:LPXTG-motif cell wall-anchored protein
MPRTTIAAVIALLLLLAPTANARPIDQGYPAYPTPEATKKAQVMPERITDTGATAPKAQKVVPERVTDHRVPAPTGSLAGTTDKTAPVDPWERYYASQAEAVRNAALTQEQNGASHAALVREQESTSGSGNQGLPRTADDDTPWAIVAAGIAGAALLAGGLTLLARRTRTRARVAA